MHDFTPASALVGGLMIGAAASLLLIGNGRAAGISSILGGQVLPQRGDLLWRVLFTIGLLVPGILAALFAPEVIGSSPRSLGVLALAGLLVGAGTRLGSGCTSGHGVCGISRLSPRSLIATLTFIAVGMLVVRMLATVAAAGGAP